MNMIYRNNIMMMFSENIQGVARVNNHREITWGYFPDKIDKKEQVNLNCFQKSLVPLISKSGSSGPA